MNIYKIVSIVFIALLIHGCGTRNIAPYNNVPAGQAKGYIDFIKDDPQKVLRHYRQWSIDRIENGIQVATPFLNGSTRYVRFTESPGIHQYFIDLGWTVEHMEVEVIENMVTPVQIKISPGEYDEETGQIISARFEFNVLNPMRP